MESQFYLVPVPKRNKYFQENPIILNSFQSKLQHKGSIHHSHSRKPMPNSFHSRLSDLSLPKIRPELSPLNFTNTKKIHFLVQGKRKTTKGKLRNSFVLPGGGLKLTTKPVREIAMGTDYEGDFEEDQSG